MTTDRAVLETRRRIELGLKQPELLTIVDGLVAEMTIVPVAALSTTLAESEVALKDAVASRNGSTKDAHILALGWAVEGDIWTTDHDLPPKSKIFEHWKGRLAELGFLIGRR